MDDVRRQLIVHERNGRIVKWHDRQIPPGDEWRQTIDARLNAADIVLLFVSPHFIESKYCYEVEGEVALRRHREGRSRAIPVILRPCDWRASPFGKLQALPRDGVPISRWPDRDEVCLAVAREVMRVVDGLTALEGTGPNALATARAGPPREKWVSLQYVEKAGIAGRIKSDGYRLYWATANEEAELVDLNGWEVVLDPAEDGGHVLYKIRDMPTVGGYLVLLKKRI